MRELLGMIEMFCTLIVVVYTQGTFVKMCAFYYNYLVKYSKKVGGRRGCGTIFRNNLLYIKAEI